MTDQQQPGDTPSSGDGVSEINVGRTLRLARERKGLSVADVAKQLRIEQRHIEAVESEDYSKVAGSVFVRGYLRNYARLLEMDPVPLITAFDRSGQSGAPKLARVGQIAPMRTRHLPTRTGKKPSTIIIVAFVVTVAWWFGREYLPLGGDSVVATSEVATPPGLNLPDRLDSAVVASDMSTPSTTTAASAGVSTGLELALPPPKTTGASVETTGAAASSSEPPSAVTGSATLGLEFARTSYAKVVDARKRILYAQTGKAGEKRWVSGQPPFSVTLGSAHDVMINLDGQAVAIPVESAKPNAVFVVGANGVQ